MKTLAGLTAAIVVVGISRFVFDELQSDFGKFLVAYIAGILFSHIYDAINQHFGHQ